MHCHKRGRISLAERLKVAGPVNTVPAATTISCCHVSQQVVSQVACVTPALTSPPAIPKSPNLAAPQPNTIHLPARGSSWQAHLLTPITVSTPRRLLILKAHVGGRFRAGTCVGPALKHRGASRRTRPQRFRPLRQEMNGILVCYANQSERDGSDAAARNATLVARPNQNRGPSVSGAAWTSGGRHSSSCRPTP